MKLSASTIDRALSSDLVPRGNCDSRATEDLVGHVQDAIGEAIMVVEAKVVYFQAHTISRTLQYQT